MASPRQIRKRVLLRALGSPVVVGPLLAGLTALTGIWAAGLQPALGAFAALAGAMTAGGVYVTRLVLRGDRIYQEVVDEERRREAQQRQQALDALDRHLSTVDDDPRTETALRDLRALVQAFEDVEKTTTSPAHLSLLFDIRSRVDLLFDQCVHSLEQSGRIWSTASGLNDPAARKPLLDQRERLIADVQSCVKQLSETLAGLQALGTGGGSSRDLARLRSELDQSLAIARTVEQRVNDFLQEPGASTPVQQPHTKQPIEE